MEKDNLIISKISDKIEQARSGDYTTTTGFLDSHEQALARSLVSSAGDLELRLYGGYEDAERRVLFCIPRGLSEYVDYEEVFAILRVEVLSSSRELTHRDYLGSLMGLGIERALIGDILVTNGPGQSADIVILRDIADYLLHEYMQVGRADVRCHIAPLAEIRMPQYRTELLRDTVPSLRLDNIIGAAFKLSRSNAVTAIKSGIVSIDHIEATKPDAKVAEGSVLVVKGRGKAVLKEVGGESKKGRIWIVVERYI